jgi:hypothetical protein
MTDDLVERAAHAANIKRTNMTEISKEWCINMAKQEEGDIGAGKLAIDPTSDNFHKLALSESFERVAKVAEERQEFNEQMALNDREAQANTIEELRAANERWVIAFKQAAAEERAKIVAYARGHGGNAWSRDVLYFAEKVEAGEHLK